MTFPPVSSSPILVTGVSGGIGNSVAKVLLESNFLVVGQTRDSTSLPSELLNHPRFISLVHALDDGDDGRRLINEVVENYGAIRGFVHCAGFDKLSPLYLNKTKVIRDLFEIHAVVPMTMVSEISKKEKHERDCSIVLISSLSAHSGAQGHTAYAAAKGAIEGFLAPASAELAARGVRLNLVTPGIVATKMSKDFIDRLDEVQHSKLVQSYPLGIGSPKNVADAIRFFISLESSWVTGQNLILDGGNLISE